MSWVIVFCSFLGVFCLIVGYLAGDFRGYRKAEHDIGREEAMERRTHPVYREPPPDFEAIRAAGRRAWAIQQQRYEEQAALTRPVALAADDPTVSAWTQQMAESMDAWLAEHVYGVPYSADELWDRQ